jgi:hexokinase
MQDLENIRDNFKSEIEKAFLGENSSLSYLKTEIFHNPSPPEHYQVMVVGGTNFSTAKVIRKNGEINLFGIVKEKLNTFKNSGELFDFIFERVDFTADTICLNFAFPLELKIRDGKIDGALLKITKEQQFSDLVGENIGESLEKYILEKTGKDINFYVANDTICLLLASTIINEPENIVAIILGTGFNLGIFEGENTLVNLEAGGFDKFEQSEQGKKIDADSFDKGENLFEKEISGAYLYQHFNYKVEEENINFEPISSTQRLFEIAFSNETDETIRKIAINIIKHSAQMVAAALAGVAEFKKNKYRSQHTGSLIYK